MNADDITKPDPAMKIAAELVEKIYRKEGMVLSWPSDEPITIREMIARTHNDFLIDLASKKDVDLFNTYAELWVRMDPNDIFSESTGLPDPDDMMKNPEYWREEKNLAFQIIHLSPHQYKLFVKSGFNSWNFEPEEHLVEDYTYKVLEGSKMPLPYLKYILNEGELEFSQEGRHRAEVAERLGAKSMPVLIITGIRPLDRNPLIFAKFQRDIMGKFK